jgi:hypothetical protein
MIPLMLIIAIQYTPPEPITNPDPRFVQIEECEE